MSSLGKFMKQAQRMQQDMQRVQAELATRTVEATSGGGVVKAIARCEGTLVSLKIDPAAVNPADVAMLEDLVVSAVNNVLNQAKEISAEEMGKVSQGINIPGLM
jgi:DNA-binding YbaB/EbfC family protein